MVPYDFKFFFVMASLIGPLETTCFVFLNNLGIILFNIVLFAILCIYIKKDLQNFIYLLLIDN